MAWLVKTLFIFMLIMTCVLGVSFNSPLMTWGMMEINMLLFIPILGLSSDSKTPDMMSFKYFFTQSLASIMLFISLLLLMLMSTWTSKISMMFSLSLVWKLGMPPFHMWLFNLLMELDWVMFFIISSWQKVLPFYMLSQVLLESADFFILFSLVVSTMTAMYQLSMKKLLIVSSIFTSSWVLSSMMFMKMWWLLFFFLYCSMLFFCSLIFFIKKMSLLDSTGLFMIKLGEKVTIFMLLMSMAGLPPLLGFYMKLLVLLILLYHLKIFILLFMIMSSIIMIYAYLSMLLSSLMMQTLVNKSGLSYSMDNYMGTVLMIYIISPLILTIY